MNGQKSLQAYASKLQERILSQKQAFLFCLSAVFLWGLLAHAYGFLHNSLSHDVLNAFIATQTEDNWKIELGRFFVPIYRSVFRGAVSLPWLLGLLGLLWTTVATYLTVKLLDIRSKLLIVLIAGVMATNITNISQIASYIYEFDINCFSLMLSVLAAYLWDRRKSIWHFLLAGILVLVSIGLYQAYFAVTVTLMVWKSVMDLFAEQDIKPVILRGLRGIGILLMGCVLYLVVGKAVYAITDIPAQNRTNVFSLSGNMISMYLGLIKPAVIWLVESILHKAYRSTFYAIAVAVVVAVLFIAAIWVIIRKKFKPGRIALIAALVILTPFAMVCTYFPAKGQITHDLTKFSIWFFFIITAQFGVWLAGKTGVPGLLTGLARTLACVLVFSVVWQNVVLANTAYVKKDMDAVSTLSTMTRVVTALEQNEDFVPGETSVAFIGITDLVTNVQGMDRARRITGVARFSALPSDASHYYYNVYKAYFEYVLRYPINLCADDVHGRLKTDPRVLEMPAYPADGCMQIIDGVMIVKLGPPT